MKLSLTQSEYVISISAVGSVVKAGSQKESDMKPHSTEAKVLEVNRKVLEKLEYQLAIAEKEHHISRDVDLNRQEAKVYVATMLLAASMQSRALGEYEKRPDDHASFSSEPGRSKADYVARLTQRMEEVNKVLRKLEAATR